MRCDEEASGFFLSCGKKMLMTFSFCLFHFYSVTVARICGKEEKSTKAWYGKPKPIIMTLHTFLWQRKWAEKKNKKKIWKYIRNFSYSFCSHYNNRKQQQQVKWKCFLTSNTWCCLFHSLSLAVRSMRFLQIHSDCTFPLPTLHISSLWIQFFDLTSPLLVNTVVLSFISVMLLWILFICICFAKPINDRFLWRKFKWAIITKEIKLWNCFNFNQSKIESIALLKNETNVCCRTPQ